MKNISKEYICLLASLCLMSPSLKAHLYVADVDEAQWNVENSPLYCRLWQLVPAYGRGIFENNAGESQYFMLESQKKVYKDGTAHLLIVPPEWKFDLKEKSLGDAPVKMGNLPLKLAEPMASTFLDSLEAGYFPEIQHPGWHPKHQVEVQMSSVNFSVAYEEYLGCLRGLYPANFNQLERTTVLFDVDKYDLKPEYFERLKLLKGYLEVDPEVRQIVVDGHTDDTGRDGYNYELSRNRAEIVASYLRQIGVPDSKILVRYHGERFPIAKNNSAAERQKNRRATLRLDKGEDATPQQ